MVGLGARIRVGPRVEVGAGIVVETGRRIFEKSFLPNPKNRIFSSLL